MPRFLDVDPQTLLVTTQRRDGPDLWKLHQQIIKYGSSTAGMPAIWVEEDSVGRFMIVNGVTRAIRAARYAPGVLVRVEVVETHKRPFRVTIPVADFV